MEARENLFGLVMIEGYGIVQVPGSAPKERSAYTIGLSVRIRIFIPSQHCESIMTVESIKEEEQPFVAIGIIESYGCFTVNDLMSIPTKDNMLLMNIPELIKFARFINNPILEGYLTRIEIGGEYFDNLRTLILALTSDEVVMAINALETLERIFIIVCPNTDNDIILAGEQLQILQSLLPTLKTVKKAGTVHIETRNLYIKILKSILNCSFCLRNFSNVTNALKEVILS